MTRRDPVTSDVHQEHKPAANPLPPDPTGLK